MATRRTTSRSRSGGSRRGKRRPSPWLVLLAGLAVGALATWGVLHYMNRSGKPFSGLAKLFDSAPETPKPKPAADRKKPEPKPRYDFYTLLPNESVLPERRPKPAPPKPAPKPAPAPTTPDVAPLAPVTPDKREPDENVVYVLQAASYANREDADRLKATLALTGLEAHIEQISIEGKGDFFRVRLGPYTRVEDLDAANARLGEQGIQGLRLKVRKPPGA